MITLSQYLNVLRFFVLLMLEFDYETRLILFDPSIFMGGIAKYNLFISILRDIFAGRLHELLYFTRLGNSISIKLINMTRDKVLTQFE